MILNKDRYSTGAPVRKLGVVVHDAESGDGAYDVLLRLLAAPGDRDNGHGGVYGAGYTAVSDGKGGYTMVADLDVGPYAAPPLNKTWAHICMPGYANQTGAQWLDDISRQHIRGVALFIVDQWLRDGKTWPLEFRSAAELVAGRGGYTSHAQVSQAWHQTDHTDPGPSFPWNVLAADIGELVAVPKPPIEQPTPPSEEDDMPELIEVQDDAAVMFRDGLVVTSISDQVTVDSLFEDKIVTTTTPRTVRRASLKAFELHGPEPSYAGYAGPKTGRTVAGDFNRHEP